MSLRGYVRLVGKQVEDKLDGQYRGTFEHQRVHEASEKVKEGQVRKTENMDM